MLGELIRIALILGLFGATLCWLISLIPVIPDHPPEEGEE